MDSELNCLRTLRTFQTEVLKQLVNWAATSIDKSINQPILPHIVIVLNATENGIDESQWDPEVVTNVVLGDYKDSVRQVQALREVADMLEARGKQVKTTKQLLENYYSSVTVIRIPSKGRYMQIDEQIEKLYDIVSSKCSLSHAHRVKARMLFNAEKLPQYVNAAYNHFSQQLHDPFDFMEEARRHIPLPQDFGGHILNLILLMYNMPERLSDSTTALFRRLARPIASCVMLAATRDGTQGNLSPLLTPKTSCLTLANNLQGSFSHLLRSTYSAPLYAAFEEFCSNHLRCSYSQDGYRCWNTRNLHEKGHQARTGKIMSRGLFQSEFDPDDFFDEWINDIDKNIVDLDNRQQPLAIHRAEKTVVQTQHWGVMADFYRFSHRSRSVSRFQHHWTCLVCVRKIPENVLPCGHILCKPCIQSFGRDSGQGLFELKQCPLHPEETAWVRPARIKFKPEEAGVRVLCLDG